MRGTGSTTEKGAMRWALALGEQRHVRDQGAARTAKSCEDDETQTTAESARRWQSIVERIRELAGAYNTGAHRAVLTVVERSEQPAVTIAAGGEGMPFLTATLEGTLICLDSCDGSGNPRVSEIRLRSDRDDDSTAAYLLQSWMERL